ncbi:hypothetical protein J1N35_038035, partial [Gossypium stocksii]
MGIVAAGDKAWAPSSGTLPSEFFKDVDNEILEKNKEENAINDVHISSQVGCDFDGNNKKKHLKHELHVLKLEGRNPKKKIKGTARLSSQIENLCSATDNMSQATFSLTPVMDSCGIPQVIKVLDSLSEEVPEA